MMKFWSLVSQAEQAQSQIISRLEKIHGKMSKNIDIQEKSEQNQFMIYDQQRMSLKVDNQVPNDPIQYTFQNSHKDVLNFQNNYEENDSLDRIEVIERFFTQPKEVQVALNSQDVQNCDFARLIQRIQVQEGKKLTQKGIEKILNALKNKMEIEKSIYQTLKPQKNIYSTEQNKLEMKTRRKRDELKKLQKQRPSKGNKQNNNDKIEVNYKGLNRMRRNNQSINTNILKTRRQNKYYAS